MFLAFYLIILFLNFTLGNIELDDSCELTEQCLQPFSVCSNGTCKCVNGYSAIDRDNCYKGL